MRVSSLAFTTAALLAAPIGVQSMAPVEDPVPILIDDMFTTSTWFGGGTSTWGDWFSSSTTSTEEAPGKLVTKPLVDTPICKLSPDLKCKLMCPTVVPQCPKGSCAMRKDTCSCDFYCSDGSGDPADDTSTTTEIPTSSSTTTYTITYTNYFGYSSSTYTNYFSASTTDYSYFSSSSAPWGETTTGRGTPICNYSPELQCRMMCDTEMPECPYGSCAMRENSCSCDFYCSDGNGNNNNGDASTTTSTSFYYSTTTVDLPTKLSDGTCSTSPDMLCDMMCPMSEMEPCANDQCAMRQSSCSCNYDCVDAARASCNWWECA